MALVAAAPPAGAQREPPVEAGASVNRLLRLFVSCLFAATVTAIITVVVESAETKHPYCRWNSRAELGRHVKCAFIITAVAAVAQGWVLRRIRHIFENGATAELRRRL